LTISNDIKPAAHDAFFLLNRLRSNKLLELHRTERRISSNLLDRKQSSRKKTLCAANFNKFSEKKLLYIIPVDYTIFLYKINLNLLKLYNFCQIITPQHPYPPVYLLICFLFNFLKIMKLINFFYFRKISYFYLPVSSLIFYLPDFYLATRIPTYPYHFYVIFLSYYIYN